MKKLLSIVLALVMVLTFMVPAFAEGTTVVYYVGDVQDGEAVAATAGETYTPDRMPTSAAPDGQYFVGWADSTGKIVPNDGITLAEGENKLTAVYKSFAAETEVDLTKHVSGKKSNIGYLKNGEYLSYVDSRTGTATKSEYVTEGEESYLKITPSQYSGGAGYLLTDADGDVIQIKNNTKYQVVLEYSIPKNNSVVNFRLQFGARIYKDGSGIAEAPEFRTSNGSEMDAATKQVNFYGGVTGLTQKWHDNGGHYYRFGDTVENPATTDGWQKAVWNVTTPAYDANFLPVFALSVAMSSQASDQEFQIKSIKVIDTTIADVQYVVNGEVMATVSGLTAGAAYNIDRLPTTAAPAGKYFAGWVDENGAAITSSYKSNGEVDKSYTLSSGTNKFYAKYVDYATSFKPNLNVSGKALAAGTSSTGAISNVIDSTTYWSQKAYDTQTGVLSAWTTVTYSQENIILLTDENGVAYEAESNSTYIVTIKAKASTPDLDAINAANAAAGATTVYTKDSLNKNEIGFGIGLKSFPAMRSGDYASLVYNGGVQKVDYTDDYVDYTFTVTTGDVSAINPQMMIRLSMKPTVQMRDSSDAATGLANINTYGANKLYVQEVSVKKVVGSVNYVVNGEAFGEGADNLTIGDTYTIDRMPENTATHYFSGWYFDEACTKYARATFTVPSEPVTLYAKMLPYVENVHLSSSGAEGTVSLANWKFWEREGNWSNAYLYYTGYYKMVDGVYKDYMYGGYGKFVPNADGTVSLKGDTWNQPAAHVITDEHGDALIPVPGATYRVTVTLKTNTLIGEGTESDISLQTGWDIAKGGSGSKDGTFDANGTFTNWNSKYDYNPGGLDNTSGNYRSSNAKFNWDGEEHTVVLELTMPTLEELKNNNLAAYMAIKTSAPASPNELIIKDIIVNKISIQDKLESATIADKEVGYVKVLDEVEDNTTYKVTFNGKLNGDGLGWSSVYALTANADNVNLNQSLIYGYNADHGVKGTMGSFGYGWTQSFTSFITTDLAAQEGNALYLYVTNTALLAQLNLISIEKVEGVKNGGVSMLAGAKETDKQALRYYFNYTTVNGNDIVIDGETYTIASRGFLLADADKVGDKTVTRTTAAEKDSGIIDANTTELTKCWGYTDNGDGTAKLEFSTYITGFKPDEGTYNNTNKLYVKGYVVLTNGSVIYSEESKMTVADVANLINAGGGRVH